MEIRDIVARRSDLSTFLVHLTREVEGHSSRSNLEQILRREVIRAMTPMGHAISLLSLEADLASQKCVCFTETPLEHVSLLTGAVTINGNPRAVNLSHYGIAIPKRQARWRGVNPIWYIDISPRGEEWLTANLNNLVQQAIDGESFAGSDIARLTPFIEQMGWGRTRIGQGYAKEFWWEREWRKVGSYLLDLPFIVLCPEEDMDFFRQCMEETDSRRMPMIDPRWSLEEIIASLAGFPRGQVDPFSPWEEQ